MSRTPEVRRNADPVSAAALASLALGRADHVDAVAVDLSPGTTAVEFARAAVVSTPEWIHKLLGLRDAIGGQVEMVVGRRLGPFKVLSVADDEVLLGDDDKHLRVRTSFAVRSSLGGTEGVFTTIAAHKNFAGHVYFACIKSFHSIIVTSVVRRAAVVAIDEQWSRFAESVRTDTAPPYERHAAGDYDSNQNLIDKATAPSATPMTSAPARQTHDLRNRYVMKIPIVPQFGGVAFTVSINGEVPTAFSAADSKADITSALHPGRNDVVVGWEADPSRNNIKELRFGEHTPEGRWSTLFSLSVGTGPYGRFPNKGTRKYSIYAR